MEGKCPRCRDENRPQARFCARCGLLLESSAGVPLRPGRLSHPNPLPAPDGFQPCAEAENLHFRWESAWGGSMLAGTESISVVLFNGGYPLEAVELQVSGCDGSGRQVLVVEYPVEELPRGREVKVEVPSYELPAPVKELALSLVSAEFANESEHTR
jgi:hypothetical protein